MTRRIFIIVEYDGAPFVGWQRQDNGITVQQKLEDAAHAFTGEKILVQGAGRTDSGVHALGQVVVLWRDAAWRGVAWRGVAWRGVRWC